MLTVLKSEDCIRSFGEPGPAARVLVAAASGLVTLGLRAVLADMPALERVGEAVDAHQALAMARRLAPDLILLDIDLAQSRHYEVVRLLREALPETRVLLVSMRVQANCPIEAVQAGAVDFIRLDGSLAEIQHAILEALTRELVDNIGIPNVAGPELDTQVRRPVVLKGGTQACASPLSRREHEVLGLLARGFSNREIAHNLVITTHTAKIHVEHILAKLEVRGRTEAAVRALEFGYLSA